MSDSVFRDQSGREADPEPDAADRVPRTEAFSMALIVVLESLTPLKRSVFVLHEVFGYPHTEIAEILGRGPATVRRIPHRARGATLGHGVPAGPLIPRCARR